MLGWHASDLRRALVVFAIGLIVAILFGVVIVAGTVNLISGLVR